MSRLWFSLGLIVGSAYGSLAMAVMSR